MQYSSRLSNADLEEVRDVFRLFDVEQVGQISVKIVMDTLSSMLQERTAFGRRNMQMDALLSNLRGFSDDKMLSMDEFTQLVMRPDPQDNRSDLQRTFDLFDVEGKGYIDANDLRKVASELGEVLDDMELNEMVERASSSGRVHLQDFEAIMTRKLSA